MATLTLSMNIFCFALALGLLTTINNATAYQWAFASMLISILAAVCAVAAVSIAFGPPSFSLQTVFANLNEGLVFSVSGSTTYIYNDLDKVMLGHYGMNAANGIYTTAYRILNICTTPITSIHNAAYPRFFQLGVGGARATEPFARKVLFKTTILGIVAAMGMFVAAPLIPHLVGNSFAKSVLALRWLCLIPLFSSLSPQCWRCHGGCWLPELSPGNTTLRGSTEFRFESDSYSQVLLAGCGVGQLGNRRRTWGVRLDCHPLAHFKREE